jgi:hypothetical protein
VASEINGLKSESKKLVDEEKKIPHNLVSLLLTQQRRTKAVPVSGWPVWLESATCSLKTYSRQVWALGSGAADDVSCPKAQGIKSLTQSRKMVFLVIIRRARQKLCERPVLYEPKTVTGIELKSLILAQIERWRHALHMQVGRQHGGNPGGEWRTGE